MFRQLLLLFLLALAIGVSAQKKTPSLERVEPPSWWVGMEENTLQLLVYGQNIGQSTVSTVYPGVSISGVSQAESKNYLFIDLAISPETRPGEFVIEFRIPGRKKPLTYAYRLDERTSHRGSLGPRDVIYLVTPDRFVNGNPANDSIQGLTEGPDREFIGGRHGGDLQGVRSKLEYMADLGVTALWLNPVLENNMKDYSYHGYAATDFYKVDPRFGSNDEYKLLSDELHSKNMKLVMDMVFNHCGLEHWWIKDLPFADWIHDYGSNLITNYSISSLSDPHAATVDKKQMERGWFVSTMPDLNHGNPFLTTYLIQNSIWWIEFAHLDGIRMDTYPYNDKDFMALWAKRIDEEYPGFYLLGETWIDSEALVSWWSDKGKNNAQAYNSHTRSMTDFPLCYAIGKAFGPQNEINALYSVLSKDFLYNDPYVNEIFADNHDMDRIFFVVGEKLERFKQAMTFLLTTRGIPQIYYGTEILMSGHGDHGVIREDFPGGWATDRRNAFTAEGRTSDENEAFQHIQTLLKWRATSEAMSTGTLTHFLPVDNIYVYNRRSGDESVLVIISNNDGPVSHKLDRYREVLEGYSGAVDVLENVDIDNLESIDLAPYAARVLSLVNKKDTNP